VRQVELKVACQYRGDCTVMSVSGELDLYTAPRLHRELTAALADGTPPRLIIDLSGVEFCDSTGINVLLAAHRRAREHGGGLELLGPRAGMRRILQVTGLETVFTVLDDPTAVAGQ
jgi:anti-sigma B factor antagonist